jgi:hypothetical protein
LKTRSRRSLVRRHRLILLALAVFALEGSAPAAREVLSRATTDRPDDVRGPQVHFVYAVPADGEDRALDTNGAIVRSVELLTNWLADQTGGGTLRVDTHRGELDITFVRLDQTDAQIAAHGAFVRDAIEAELQRHSAAKQDRIYAVYYDGSSRHACGGAFRPPTLIGSVVAMYLRGTPSGGRCSPHPPGGELDYWEFAMLHDLLHGLGLVANCAPNHGFDGHVTDHPNDLMWGGAGGPWQLPPTLDIGRDDYYRHGRSDCPDLAKSEYLTSNPPPPQVLRAAGLSLTPARAGRQLTVSLAIFLDDIYPDSAKVGCTLHAQGRKLTPTRATYAGDRARCAWRLPLSARGKRLIGRVRAEVEGLSVQRTFTARAR